MFNSFNGIVQFIGILIGYDGYSGVAVLSFLESIGIPAPVELFIPVAAHIAKTGRMNLFSLIVFATFGSFIGSLASYVIANKILHPILFTFFKHIHFIRVADAMSKAFAKHGFMIIFISRFIPILRSYISIPAGLSKMNKLTFSAATFLGSLIWISILSIIGYNYGYSTKLTDFIIQKDYIYIAIFLAVVLIINMIVFISKKGGIDKKMKRYKKDLL